MMALCLLGKCSKVCAKGVGGFIIRTDQCWRDTGKEIRSINMGGFYTTMVTSTKVSLEREKLMDKGPTGRVEVRSFQDSGSTRSCTGREKKSGLMVHSTRGSTSWGRRKAKENFIFLTIRFTEGNSRIMR